MKTYREFDKLVLEAEQWFEDFINDFESSMMGDRANYARPQNGNYQQEQENADNAVLETNPIQPSPNPVEQQPPLA